MNRQKFIVLAILSLGVMSCNPKSDEPRPSGLKNMAPPSIQEAVQEGLDVEPNNTFLQAVGVTLTGDTLQWVGTLGPDDVDVWLLKAKAGTITDIVVTPESDFDVVAEFANAGNEKQRHYYDNGVSGQPEMLPNIRLTPQGGYLTVKGRMTDSAEPLRYRITLSRVLPENENGIVEAEINDERTDAMQLNGTSLVEGVLYPRGDVDYYHVTLKAATAITFELSDGAHEVAIEHNDKIIWSEISKQAQMIKSAVLPPDLQDVYIRLKSLDDLREPHRYSFSVSELEKIPDEIEPNNTIDKAQTIQGEGQNLEFSLLDDADIDIFKVMVDPGRVYRARLVGVQSGQAKLQLLSDDGNVRNDVLSGDMVVCDAFSGEKNSIWLKVLPGVGTWPLNYRIAIDSESAENVEKEPNQTSELAMTIEPGMTLYGHIFPSDDVDVYRIKIPEYPRVEGPVGKLQIDIEGGYVAPLQLKLQDKDGYEVSQLRNEQYSRPMHLTFDAPNGEYDLAITGGGDDCIKPYALRVSFEPSAEAIESLTALAAPANNVADGNTNAADAVPVKPAVEAPAPNVPVNPDAPAVDIPIDDLIQAAQDPNHNEDVPKKSDEDEDAF